MKYLGITTFILIAFMLVCTLSTLSRMKKSWIAAILFLPFILSFMIVSTFFIITFVSEPYIDNIRDILPLNKSTQIQIDYKQIEASRTGQNSLSKEEVALLGLKDYTKKVEITRQKDDQLIYKIILKSGETKVIKTDYGRAKYTWPSFIKAMPDN